MRIIFFLLVVISFTSNGNSLSELKKLGHVDINVSIEADSSISPKQQILLIVDVGTDTWFTGGTKIGHIEVENAIVLKRNQLAMNYSERKGGKSWARQRWEITVYPTASGQYAIQPFSVELSVSGPNRKKITGKVITKPLSFSVSSPAAFFNEDTHWFSASAVTINQTWNIEADTKLHVGDAITRTITVQATDTTAVLLPTFFTNTGSIAALGREYISPAELTDTQHRGNYQAQKVESTTIILQHAGEYQLPAQEMLWWNVTTQTLERVNIDGRTVVIAHTPLSWLKHYKWHLIISLLALLSFWMIAHRIERYYQTHPVPPVIAFIINMFRGNKRELIKQLYQHLLNTKQQVSMSQYLRSHDNDEAELSEWRNLTIDSKNTNRYFLIQLWLKIKEQKRSWRTFPRAIPKLEKITYKRDNNDN